MAYKIAICNIKGGCGKTSTAINLADQLMARGKRVLLVDTDTQRNATVAYGAEYKGVATLDDIFKGGLMASDCIQTTGFGDIIAGDDALVDADTSIKPGPKMYKYLQKALAGIEDKYDYIIIDTPPRFGILLGNALECVDGVIIPSEVDIFGIQGLSDVFGIVEEFKEDNENLRVLGILKVKYKKAQKLSNDVETNILPEYAKTYNTKVFKTCIREGVKLREAQALQVRLTEYQKYSNPALDYSLFTDELLKEIEK